MDDRDQSNDQTRLVGSQSSRTPGGERFVPGTRLGKRFRITSLLGRGGMGEVYRADDLELGQTVALKLLPPQLAQDEAALARLRNEVRVARQVSHPNVCRVYDITEADGHSFIAMEYVDGEDLASVLRRMGRPTKEKSLDIARQICAGLAAAHEQGILHRDLKPANVMLDGRGRVRIMDFGLGGFAAELRDERSVSGTPAYMAPEQLRGEVVSERSDIYSLGLLLYELFSGKRPYTAGSVAELQELHAREPDSSLSDLILGLDPAVEEAITRCLAHDPTDRPPSVVAVAAALPGGDPLAAAVAAGETPSPELIAASGGRGGLRPGLAWLLFAVIMLGFAVVAKINDRAALFRIADLHEHPVALASKAREILALAGCTEEPAVTNYGFRVWGDNLHRIEAADSSKSRWDRIAENRPTVMHFAYYETAEDRRTLNPQADLGFFDPPLMFQGVRRVDLCTNGRLIDFELNPMVERCIDEDNNRRDLSPSVAWGPFFAAAGLDSTAFERITRPPDYNRPNSRFARRWRPSVPYDTLITWRSEPNESGAAHVTVWTASFKGVPVFFRSYPHYSEFDGAGSGRLYGRVTKWILGFAEFLFVLLIVAAVIGVPLLARKQWRSGRGDRRGALRAGGVVFALSLLSWALRVRHVTDPGWEIQRIGIQLGSSLLVALLFALAYFSLEPFVRRNWPHAMISWSRLLAGRFRDPRVGKDVLVGGTAAVIAMILDQLQPLVPTLFGEPMGKPLRTVTATLLGNREAISAFLNPEWIVQPLLFILLSAALLAVLKRKLPAVLISWAIFAFIYGADAFQTYGRAVEGWSVGFAALQVSLFAICLFRFGWLTLIFGVFILTKLFEFPITLDTSAWYAGTSFALLAVLTIILLFAARTATAGMGRESS